MSRYFYRIFAFFCTKLLRSFVQQLPVNTAVFSREEAVTVIELIDHDTMQTMTGSPEYVVMDAMT